MKHHQNIIFIIFIYFLYKKHRVQNLVITSTWENSKLFWIYLIFGLCYIKVLFDDFVSMLLSSLGRSQAMTLGKLFVKRTLIIRHTIFQMLKLDLVDKNCESSTIIQSSLLGKNSWNCKDIFDQKVKLEIVGNFFLNKNIFNWHWLTHCV